MFQAVPRERPWVTWLFLGAWIVAIYATIPYARALQSAISSLFGPRFVIHFTVAGVVVAAAVAVRYVVRHPEMRALGRSSWMAVVVAAYVFFCSTRLQTPQEALHFLEYGFLGLLAFRAVSHSVRNVLVYPCAVLICSLVGNADEIIQWLTPNRYWDLRDWGWNTVAAALAQVAVAGAMRPPYVRGPVTPASVRRLVHLAVLQILVLSLCMSNTPRLVDWYAERVPGLRYLKTDDQVMSEYGYRHEDPECGVFFSRLRLPELASEDARRGREAAEILRAYQDSARYEEFLDRYSPGRDPFVHEARVHLFRRDHYYLAAWKHQSQPELYRHHLTVAYRENEILARYFPVTMAAYGALYDEPTRERLRAGMDRNKPYRSPVSAHLITHLREGQVWILTGLALAAAFVILRRCDRRALNPSAPC